jgi:hypothetical protein
MYRTEVGMENKCNGPSKKKPVPRTQMHRINWKTVMLLKINDICLPLAPSVEQVNIQTTQTTLLQNTVYTD